jgi:fatty acid desaturase
MVMPDIDHKAFLAGIPPEERLALTRRSDLAGLVHLAGHLALIGILATLIVMRIPFWGVLVPLQGILIVFLFTLAHECTHKTPFAQSWLNEGLGHLCGFLLVLPFHWFRAFHLAHHRWTNLPGLDPELDGGKPGSLKDWIIHVSGLPYWWSEIRLVVRLAAGNEHARYIPEAGLPRMQAEARWMLLGYVMAIASLAISPVLFWIWILPVILGQPALRLYLLAEHGDCPEVANMFTNTRTVFTTAMLRFLAWNMPYHTEHHVWPSVPFHRLPALHRRMKSHLAVTEDGYIAFNRAYLARRLVPDDRSSR